MDVVRSLVQNLIVLVVLAVFLEMFLPLGEMRKYVKMVMGFLIVITVIQAVGNLLHRDYFDDLPVLIDKKADERFSSIMEAGKNISNEQEKKAIKQYELGLAHQVLALAGMNKKITVTDAEVSVYSEKEREKYGQINKVVIFVERESNKADKDLVKNSASDITPVSVRVQSKPDVDVKEERSMQERPPNELTADLIKTIANFYNLKQEQVDCLYR